MKNQAPPKLIKYFEKYIQECKRWEKRMLKQGGVADLAGARACTISAQTIFKYVKSGRWLK